MGNESGKRRYALRAEHMPLFLKHSWVDRRGRINLDVTAHKEDALKFQYASDAEKKQEDVNHYLSRGGRFNVYELKAEGE